MLALGLGLAAALIWAVHDLLVRRLSQGAQVLPMLLVVMASGVVALLVPVAIWGGWGQITPRALWFCAASGLAYAAGGLGLYKAFQLAPVRIVAPILGAYPMISLMIAAAQGKVVSGLEALAVLAIVAGIAVVALSGKAEGEVQGSLARAVAWAVLGAVGFAATFALGHVASASGAEGAVVLITRGVTLLGVGGMLLITRTGMASVRGQVPVLALMGVLDALALGLVIVAGGLPSAEYAAITSSLFGVITILLAWRFLGETVARAQWLGILVVFAGIGVLAAQG